MRSPIWWFGGKGLFVSKLLPLIPRHRIYVEPFGGGASLLFAKPPSKVEVYNDLDSGLVNFFRVLRDKKSFKRFCEYVALTPYAREEYYDCVKTWESEKDPVIRAAKWFTIARMSFGGKFGKSWGFIVNRTSNGMAGSVAGWLKTIERLPEIVERLQRVQIDHLHALEVIGRYDTEETFFYLDPPYVPETRKSGKYAVEMSVKDHEVLVETLLQIKGMALLSGYRHEVYRPLEEAGWQVKQWKTTCSAAGRTRISGLQGIGKVKEKQQRIEAAWISPRAQKRLDQCYYEQLNFFDF